MQIKPGLEDSYAEYKRVNDLDHDDSGYSLAVVEYGEKWAALMETEILRRELVPSGSPEDWPEDQRAAYENGVLDCIVDVAERMSNEANNDSARGSITGFQYGVAAGALSHYWVHGEALRRWHNRQYLSEERATEVDQSGGIVNPAVMTLRSAE